MTCIPLATAAAEPAACGVLTFVAVRTCFGELTLRIDSLPRLIRLNVLAKKDRDR